MHAHIHMNTHTKFPKQRSLAVRHGLSNQSPISFFTYFRGQNPFSIKGQRVNVLSSGVMHFTWNYIAELAGTKAAVDRP